MARAEHRWQWGPMSPSAVAALFARADARWWLSGGCALDLWLGRVTRAHSDIDVSVLRSDAGNLLRHLPLHLVPFTARSGELVPITDPPTPSNSEDATGAYNVWVLNNTTDRWVLQINIEEGDAQRWRYRRSPHVSRAWDEAVLSASSRIPIVHPAVQLLWKSQQPVDKDDNDFREVIPALGIRDRDWLVGAMKAAHPGSRWLASNEPGPAPAIQIRTGYAGKAAQSAITSAE